ncbi:hypothetical protein HN604_01765 [archaeon]|jgi:hypothetical protein|nr:hypothetical protein [archaeon]MBT6182748.1 hypothetical protein [archaeon]MBT6606555.1 hypothetical protein [archaeon]MBT7251818.1 hypothetical protein [archaeon]MBT7660789.1 hypothetical protein [archaeon]
MELDSEITFGEEYEELREKYSLPEFDKLAEDFDIEKVSEKESTFILREIRRMIHEKLSAYLSLFEMLVNPSAPPMFMFGVIKKMNGDHKELIKKVYENLVKLQISIMKLDTVYSEKSEAEFIIRSFSEWQDMKVKIHDLIDSFEQNVEKNDSLKKTSYFG